MRTIQKLLGCFSRGELALWGFSTGILLLTFRRSPYYALAYAANDGVPVVLWVLAAMDDKSYLPVAVCFLLFLINDLYGFVNWRKMEKRQRCAGLPSPD